LSGSARVKSRFISRQAFKISWEFAPIESIESPGMGFKSLKKSWVSLDRLKKSADR